MTAIQRREDETSTEFEGQIREFVRRDVSFWQRSRTEASDGAANSVNALIERVAGASLHEIEHAIRELEIVRDRLKSEGDRVQREISGYASLSQTAMASLRVINESLAQLQPAAEPPTPAE